MKTILHYSFMALAMLALATLNGELSTACAQGTAFTYQGHLNNGGNPANGLYDFRFKLASDNLGDNYVGDAFLTNAIPVTNGLFTATVDFGAGIFTGSNYWLEVDVRTNNPANTLAYTTLAPLQGVTPTPYAIFAESSSNLVGTLPTANLAGTYGNAVTLNNAGNSFTGNGSGLAGLNASQLTSGTVADTLLEPDVALTDANQTFTGINTFSGTGESLIVSNSDTGISTSLFTGLGFQYYPFSGEGAIMSSYDDGFGYLSFYTKQDPGYPIVKQVIIDQYGGVAIDQQNYNSGVIDNGTTNGVGLTFGSGSGEGIASQRTAGLNQYGLDFYTDFQRRMSILNNGYVGIGVGTNTPVQTLEVGSGSIQVDDGDVFLTTNDNPTSGYGLGYRTGLPGISPNGPFLYGYNGGALGGLVPTTIALSWDYKGNVWVSNNLATASLTIHGGTTFNCVQDGIFTAGAAGTNYNLIGGNTFYTKVVTNSFPTAFSSVPNVTVSAVSQPGTDWPDVYCLTVREVTTTNLVVNIQRIDSTTAWAQSLQISYHAWQ